MYTNAVKPHQQDSRPGRMTPALSRNFHLPAGVQRKLQVGSAHDPQEREADVVAEQVVNPKGNTPLVDTPVMRLIQRKCAACSQEEEGVQRTVQRMHAPATEEEVQKKGAPEEDEQVQRKGDPGEGFTASADVSQRIQAQSGKGSPLPENTRAEMETGFGTDFSSVRVHTGPEAAQLSQGLNAQAFTHGNDIFFNSGKLDTGSTDGKKLLAHELTHTIQQGGVKRKIQRAFEPADAAAEMIGKQFKLDADITVIVSYWDGSGLFQFPKLETLVAPKGTVMTAKEWDNTSHQVYVSAWVNTSAGKKEGTFYADKSVMTPYTASSSGLYKYSAGISSVKTNIQSNDKKIKALEARRPEFVKFNNLSTYNADHAQLTSRQETRYTDLNEKLIQETMYNSFDASIVKWVDHYHTQIGEPKKWDKPDANLIKAMIWKETGMGTRGQHLPESPPASGSRKTRFNITQSIDSSGPQQILMMDEMSPGLNSKHNYRQVTTDFNAAMAAKKKIDENNSKPGTHKISAVEQAAYDLLKFRCLFPVDGKDKWFFNEYYTQDSRWMAAVKEFSQQTSPERYNTYDFWIRTGVRWLYEKRKGVSSWSEAIKAYNGSGTDASSYRDKIISLRDGAKSASKAGTAFVPN